MHRPLLLLLTLALALAAAAAAQTPASPQIFSARLDGTDERSLSGGEQPAALPVQARDGRIAFIRPSGERRTYWVMNPDGSGQREVAARHNNAFGIAWSPTGKVIAFSRWDYSQCGPDSRNCSVGEIALVDAASGALRRVVRSRFRGAGWFSWAPDGSRLALAGELNGDGVAHTIETVRADGTGRRVVLRLPPTAMLGYSDVAWSPRGDRIAYVHDGWVRLVGTRGGATTRLVRGHSPFWSPRGDKLLFVSRSQGRVSVLDLATRRTRLLGPADGVFAPAPWSPYGRHVTFEVRTGDVATVWVVRVADGRLVHTWQPAGGITPPSFTRDGTRLLYSRSLP